MNKNIYNIIVFIFYSIINMLINSYEELLNHGRQGQQHGGQWDDQEQDEQQQLGGQQHEQLGGQWQLGEQQHGQLGEQEHDGQQGEQQQLS
jgi:hypothetical protein